METEARGPQETSPRRKDRGKDVVQREKCMFKDGLGRWHLDYYTPDGKRRRQLIGKNKGAALARLSKIRVAKDEGEYVDAANSPTFADFAQMFKDQHGQHMKSYRRLDCYIDALKAYFGKVRLSRINSGHIESFRLKLLDEKSRHNQNSPVSLSTVNRQVQILRAMLTKAVKWGKLAKNPAFQVEDYKEPAKRERFLSTDEIRTLLRATKSSNSPILRPVVYLALQTGMRKSEMLNLRWADVNFEASKILVRETKSGEPRQVPMSRRARWLFSKLAARSPLSEWVFETTRLDGSVGPARDTKTAWQKALRRARIQKFRFHDLRHTFASHFAMRRGDIYALSEILGHSNPKITLDRYAHLSPEYVQAQGVIIDRMYSKSENRGHFMDTTTERRARDNA